MAAIGSACGGEVTDFELNVTVGVERIVVYAREAARECRCSSGEWPSPGECLDYSDGISCDCEPPPAACLEEVRVERRGVVVAATDVTDRLPGLAINVLAETTASPFSGEGLELVVQGCGGVARISLDGVDLPTPVLEVDLADTSGDGETDDVQVAWTASFEAASAVLNVGNGFGTRVCHVVAPSRSFPFGGVPDMLFVSVFASRAPVVVETELGAATVWAGSGTGQMLTP